MQAATQEHLSVQEKQKIFKSNGYEFKLIEDNLLLKNSGNRLLLQYVSRQKKLELEIDLDLDPLKKYQGQLSDYKKAIDSFSNTKDSEAEKKKKIKVYEEKIKQVEKDFAKDKEAQYCLEMQNTCGGIAIKELSENVNYTKPFLTEVLIGDVEKLDFKSNETAEMAMEVIKFFFISVISTK